MVDKNILAAIKLKHKGRMLEAMLTAWEKYPTMKSDCQLTRKMKELARNDYAKKIMNEEANHTINTQAG